MYVIKILLLCVISTTIGHRCKIMRTKSDIICDCSNRGYRELPKHIPVNTTILNLSGNKFTLLRNDTFSEFKELHTLSIKSSGISQLGSNTFNNLDKLQTLDLSRNYLDFTSFPKTIFNSLLNLTYLDLSENEAQFSESYPDASLSVLKRLQVLNINGIREGSFGSGFSTMTELKVLKFLPCGFTELLNGTFTVFEHIKLEKITLQCHIKRIESASFFPLKGLKNLDLSNNNMKISDIIPSLAAFKDTNMTSIILKRNYWARLGADVLTPQHFQIIGQICLQKLDLEKNFIAIIQSGSIPTMKYKHCLVSLNLSRNKLYGDIGTAFELFELTGLKVIDITGQDPLIPGSGAGFPTFPSDKSIIRRLVPEKTTHYKSRPYVVSFPLPPSLEAFYASKLVCNPMRLINVNLTSALNLKVLDFNWAPVRSCNATIYGIKNLDVLRVSGFNCSSLNMFILQPFKRLRVLDSRSASLGKGLKNDKDGMFLNGLTQLEEIDFSANAFSQMNDVFFRSQGHSLTRLILKDNVFSEFPISVQNFTKLQYIDISYSKIRYLSTKTMKELDTLNNRVDNKLEVHLNNNYLECNCESMHFIEWLHQTNVTLDNKGNYTCEYIDGSKTSTTSVYRTLKNLKTKCVSKLWLVLAICLSIILIIILVGSIIGYKYRVTLQYWYLSIRRKYRHYVRIEGESKDYKYSAFVAYHHSDYKWVCGPLCSFLEKEKGLSLCLHHRDFVPGNLIADNIIEAVSISRKVVMVVSKNFLESSWCEFELDMARMQMFQENRDMLIVILLHSISSTEMPKSLLKIWNKVTCIEASSDFVDKHFNADHIFWKRLYESLIQ